MPEVNPWNVTTDAKALRRLGKTGEELGELQAVICRIIIQGVDEIDPSSGKTNRVRLMEELSDVTAQLGLLIDDFSLCRNQIVERVIKKRQMMREWEDFFKEMPDA